MIELTIFGCGNMGRAFAEGLLQRGTINPENIYLIERREERRKALREELGCTCDQAPEKPIHSPYILLAVKPQDLAAAAQTLSPLLNSDHVILSLLAGVSIDVLKQAFPNQRKFVRSMPNLPAIIGAGMTAFYAASEISSSERDDIATIFSSVGEVLELKDERMLNAVTAVSGSGPAYLYYVINAWRNAATSLGFSDDDANLLIHQTLTGALWLWNDSGFDEDALRSRVTSKGGTTEAAITHLQKQEFARIFSEAIQRAAERGYELEVLAKEKL